MAETYTPKAYVTKELREISRDFTRPEEMVREGIHNSLDAAASEIRISAYIDDTLGQDELVVEITDDGVGMDLDILKSFFDLGRSTKRGNVDTIGEKGHGTKIYYNSQEVIVTTKFLDNGKILQATLTDPFRKLNMAVKKGVDDPPTVEIIDLNIAGNYLDGVHSGTHIFVRGYDNNICSTFSHRFLKDYIQWFTAWGSVKCKTNTNYNPNCKLFLKGLGQDEFEEIPYGHPFPKEIYDFSQLKEIDPRRPENYYVRCWVSSRPVIDFPQHKVDVVFCLEGDSAKRQHNEMLKWPGKPRAGRYRGDDQYTVSDRYGIYLCKDYIPVQRRNQDFAERSEWTKWHAFVNCQAFGLTANRATVDNTPKDLLIKIIETAQKIITEDVVSTDEYQDFAERVKIEAGRRKAELEKQHVKRRLKNVKAKMMFKIEKEAHTLEFREPRSEQGVIWLLAQIKALWPNSFKWTLTDLDAHFGYDLLVEQPRSLTSSTDQRFVECKYILNDEHDFNHSFNFLHQIICWDTPLQDGEDLEDIQKKTARFQSYHKDDDWPYRRYFLDAGRQSKIEVIVLRRLLEDLFNLKSV